MTSSSIADAWRSSTSETCQHCNIGVWRPSTREHRKGVNIQQVWWLDILSFYSNEYRSKIICVTWRPNFFCCTLSKTLAAPARVFIVIPAFLIPVTAWCLQCCASQRGGILCTNFSGGYSTLCCSARVGLLLQCHNLHSVCVCVSLCAILSLQMEIEKLKRSVHSTWSLRSNQQQASRSAAGLSTNQSAGGRWRADRMDGERVGNQMNHPRAQFFPSDLQK